MSVRFSGISLLLLGFLVVDVAQAVPAFSRKYELSCSSCHNAFPQLNVFGRQFKERGYRLAAEGARFSDQISDGLQLEQHVPLAGIVAARPYDRTDSGGESNRALHEVEVIAAGTIGADWSAWFEIEAEDETDFDAEIATAALTYTHSEKLNVQFVWGSPFWSDPYGILGDHFRLTRGHLGVIDQRFGGADANGRLRSNRQNFGIYGRPTSRLFYSANWSGAAEDAEGEGASTYSGSIAFDVARNIMVGGFALDGEDEATNRDFSRYGIQFQGDFNRTRAQAIFASGSDDRAIGDPRGPGEDDNDAFSVQAFHTFTNGSGEPKWVPLVRIDSTESNDGSATFRDLTLNLGHYFTQNIKAYIEYWDRFDAPTAAQEDNRITIQVVAAF